MSSTTAAPMPPCRITEGPILSDGMMARFAARAPEYDRDNRFFTEDFEELRKSRYLLQAVPKELGGGGCSLADIVRQQRRLGYYAAPTALAINMHLYWTGIAADLWRAGDQSLRWLLEEAVRGGIFAAGHAEAGNDIPVLLSTTKAEKVKGGYRFTGRKSFGSLSPVWTFLGIHGMDTSGPTPTVVHAFLPRDAQGFRIEENWDVMGMRATRSDDTILDGAFVPDEYIARVVPALCLADRGALPRGRPPRAQRSRRGGSQLRGSSADSACSPSPGSASALSSAAARRASASVFAWMSGTTIGWSRARDRS